jgi:protein-tyrosine phosphatase
LWQGGVRDARNITLLKKNRIRVVVFTAKEHNDFSIPDCFDTIRVRLDDKSNPDADEIRRYVKSADAISDRLLPYLLRGDSVLSSCRLGLNRSALISSFVLVKLGFTGEEAIKLVRRARGAGALYNPAFRRIIRAFAQAWQRSAAN